MCRFRIIILALLSLAGLATPTPGQEVNIPDAHLNAVIRGALQKPNGPLTKQDLLGLTNLLASFQNITNLDGLSEAQNLRKLFLDDNHITGSAIASVLPSLTNLNYLDLSENPLLNLVLPGGLTNLEVIRLELCGLTNLTLPFGLRHLSQLQAGFNQLPTLNLPGEMTNLNVLSIYLNQLTNLVIPPNLTNLTTLNLDGNRLSSLILPSGFTRLDTVIAGGNLLTSFTVPADMTNLMFLRLNDNLLTNLTLPPNLNHLSFLYLPNNPLSGLTLAAGMTNLSALFVSDNQLTSLTLPPDLTNLSTLDIGGNPITSLVLSEPLAAATLAPVVAALQTNGVTVHKYPLAVRLDSPGQSLNGDFRFGLTGPPGQYTVFGTGDFAAWQDLGTVTNTIGSAVFTNETGFLPERMFYRARLQNPPANMVFVPPNTFTMGSPASDLDRSIFEGPQATVTLTHGFWIGKYEVTQGEYLSVTGENPTDFPGDLNRPVSSVTWYDATNYCAMLTQRELAAGRIPAGSVYRLPTEAEWECAARAGTTTRFSYGDDPGYEGLKNYAWFLDLGNLDLTVHAVGQKLPNTWGLYDTAGNVWEWCQDWYGEQTGGVLIDPKGPDSNAGQFKVMRGGAYDYPDSSCRAGTRLFIQVNHPDSDLGFRVVLVTGT